MAWPGVGGVAAPLESIFSLSPASQLADEATSGEQKARRTKTPDKTYIIFLLAYSGSLALVGVATR